MEKETFENVLKHTKCIDLLKGQKIIEIDSETLISEGCQVIRLFFFNLSISQFGVNKILVKNGISSAPVYDFKSKTYVGMLDYNDLVEYILLVFKKKNNLSDSPISEEESLELSEIINKAQRGESVSIKYVSGKLNFIYFCLDFSIIIRFIP